ncbi:YggT family protein [Bifidobacterium bohemicum]|uniref:Putative integral membrane protein n=1 Tax=Bifidobacterium bohemicum DSM 22767 TaxID=1437606 RepID=A0A086ZGI5_9BIFI|nr:YggT family protein [Bifidobacterium bohemicum]KFI45635.1 putative integral membrane protein [Bifidobacterium bohemicum DSM 22767]SCB99971.1 YggT family protein [Bifidobacterium bohemicum]
MSLAFIFFIKLILSWAIRIYSTILLLRIIMDWVFALARNWRPGNVIMSIYNVLYSLTQPPLRWLGRYIPPLRLGSVGLDFTPIVLWFILDVIAALLVY